MKRTLKRPKTHANLKYILRTKIYIITKNYTNNIEPEPTTETHTSATMALTVVKPAPLLYVGGVTKKAARLSLKSIITAIMISILNLFI